MWFLLISKCKKIQTGSLEYINSLSVLKCLNSSVFSLPLCLLFCLFPDFIQPLWRACGQQIVSSNTQWFTTKQHCPSKAVQRHFLYQQRESFDRGFMCMLVLFSIMVILYWTCGLDVVVVSCYWKSLVCCTSPKMINPLLCTIIPLGKKKIKQNTF